MLPLSTWGTIPCYCGTNGCWLFRGWFNKGRVTTGQAIRWDFCDGNQEGLAEFLEEGPTSVDRTTTTHTRPSQVRDSEYAGSSSQLGPPPPIAPPQHVRSSSSPMTMTLQLDHYRKLLLVIPPLIPSSMIKLPYWKSENIPPRTYGKPGIRRNCLWLRIASPSIIPNAQNGVTKQSAIQLLYGRTRPR